jgi:molecular chaperone GrpE (heat shock protein)
MRDPIVLRLSKWPFVIGDGLMVGLGYLLFAQSKLPLGHWEMMACVLCFALGAACGVWPFVLEYRVFTKLLVADRLAGVAGEIRKLEQVAGQIGHATGQWQSVQESAEKTARSAKDIADRMAAELKDFGEFMRLANEGERATLRLEVDKLRRAETDWLQALVRVLDHVNALHQAGVRSGQPSLIEQLGLFQNSCREAARRVGLNPFMAAPGEPFDEKRHQVADGAAKPAQGAVIEETIGAGYTYQGRLLRPAVVRVRDAGAAAPRRTDSTVESRSP